MAEEFSAYEVRRAGFLLSTDPARLELDVVYAYLAGESYWARGIARSRVERMVQHSLCFGVYGPPPAGRRQVGFGRVISDYTTYAYMADIFVLRSYRGQGLGKWLVGAMLAHPELQGLRQWTLKTRNARDFYRSFGFDIVSDPENHMVFRPPPVAGMEPAGDRA